MPTYVIRNGELIDKSTLSIKMTDVHHVISDSMPMTRHMGNGLSYDSKSEFRKATKAAGCVEYGNEVGTLLKPRKPVPLDRAKRREDVRRALYEVRNGIRR